MNTIYWVLYKEMKLFFADRQGALMMIFAPVMLGVFFGMLTASSGKSVEVKLLVVDEDQSEASKSLIAALDASESLRIEITDKADAERRIKEGDARVALVLPKGAGEHLGIDALVGGEPFETPLLYDPSHELQANIARGLIVRSVMQEVMGSVTDGTRARTGLTTMIHKLRKNMGDDATPAMVKFLDAGMDAVGEIGPSAGAAEGNQGGISMEPPLSITKTALTASSNSKYNSYAHSFAGGLCIFILMMAVERGRALIAERTGGSLVRLQLAPGAPWQVLTGFALGVALIALAITGAVFGVGMAVFGIELLGGLLGFAAMAISFAILTGGFALLVAGISKTEAQLSAIGPVAVLALSFLGGAMFPAFLFPDWLQSAVVVTPTWWVNEGFAAATWRGLGLAHSLTAAGVVTAYGVVFGLIGIRTFRF